MGIVSIKKLFLLFLLFASQASAQISERVEVTGSHIKRVDTEGASPIQTITRKEIEKSGYNAVADVLRDSTSSSFGGAREQSGSAAAGQSNVDLRGLGATNTLVLLNGQRLPSDAITGAVDLNLIPMAAIERIEVLKDGASAIYGSDALGGVVNIITRKDFSGTEVSLSSSIPEMKGGGKNEISLVNGINKEKFNVVTVLQFRDNKKIYSRDRDWTSGNLSKVGSPGSYSSDGGTTWVADTNCPADLILRTSDGDFCRFRYSDYSTELPEIQQLGLLSETNYELNSKVRLKARLGYVQRQVKWNFAPAAGSAFLIPGAVADTLGPGGGPLPGATPGEDLLVLYRPVELGNRDTLNTSRSYNLLIGSTIDLGKGWEFDTNVSHNVVEAKDEGTNGYADKAAIISAIQGGSFNPFATPGSRGSLEHTRYNPVELTNSKLTSLEGKAAGTWGQIDSRDIGVALGTTLTTQSYVDSFDEKSIAGQVYGNAGSSGRGSRNTQAVFTEFSFPLTEKMELQLAARYDRYSDFGDTTNPKLAVLYHASSSLLLRSSVGTGFKAPLMQDLYAASSDGNPTFIDQVECANDATACVADQHRVISSGNKNLDAEKSLSFNVGSVYSPNSDFSISADYFLTKTKNVVGIDYEDLTIAEKNGVNLSQYNVVVNRYPNGSINYIQAPMQNLSSQEVSGLDLASSYQLGKWKLSVEHAHLFYFKSEGFPGAGFRDKLGENGRPAWRNVVGIDYAINNHHNVSLSALTTAGQDQAEKGTGRLNDYTTVDSQYVWKTQESGTFSIGIKNVLGTTPPLDTSSPNTKLNGDIYDQIGRQYYAAYKIGF